MRRLVIASLLLVSSCAAPLVWLRHDGAEWDQPGFNRDYYDCEKDTIMAGQDEVPGLEDEYLFKSCMYARGWKKMPRPAAVARATTEDGGL